MNHTIRCILTLAALIGLLAGCGQERETPAPAPAGPSILLVTLDTTRADSIGPDASAVSTPAFDRVAGLGARFTHAYTTVPETLPSHASIMTGLYPAGHGVHENSRSLRTPVPLVSEILADRGYTTAAFISGYPLSRQFGLARGFDEFDDELGGAERSASATTDRAIDWLERSQGNQLFLWVHYFDPHYPYEPPAPFDAAYAENPYLGEIAAMDEQLGRLIDAARSKAGESLAIVVVGDHGEGLGDHGEAQHGNLLYQSTMHVPLVIAGPGVSPSVVDEPVSIRRVFHTILEWAGGESRGTGNGEREGEAPAEPEASVNVALSLTKKHHEVVMGEAMKPYLNYGWQPQTMAVEGSLKVIDDGRIVAFDVAADPEELYDVSSDTSLSREVRKALREYPIPSIEQTSNAEISEEDRKQLASLGYIASDTRPVVRVDAPRPTEMTDIFPLLDRASALFESQRYEEAIPILRRILDRDRNNLMAALRLAAAHSAAGNDTAAIEAFHQARAIAPDSPDVDHYLSLHLLRRGEWQTAAPLVEKVLARNPKRLAALGAMAEIRERQGRLPEALTILEQIESMRPWNDSELLAVGRISMALGRTPAAIEAFEALRERRPDEFAHDLELGVLYIDSRRFPEARTALDRILQSRPDHPMALFKRAQVSVLLREPGSAQWIARARENADQVTAPLIEREELFR